MLAFVVFVTWSGYSDATKDLQMEANLADDLFHIAQSFQEPARTVMQKGLLDYLTLVQNDELQRMAEGDIADLFLYRKMSGLIESFYHVDEKLLSK